MPDFALTAPLVPKPQEPLLPGTIGPDEASARLAAAVTPYGLGTRSYNRSPEKTEMDRQRAELNARYAGGEIKFDGKVPLICYCRSFQFGHSPDRHKELLSDHDWRTWQQRANMRVYEPRIS